MKLRNGWKAHGNQWKYKENDFGASVESVFQFTQNGVKRYEAHFRRFGCCGFAETLEDLHDYKRFDNREDAMLFCEEKYNERMLRRQGGVVNQ